MRNGRSVSSVCSRSHGQPFGARRRLMMSTSRGSDAPAGVLGKCSESMARTIADCRAIRALPRAAGASADVRNHVTTKSIRREKLSFDDPEALQALCGSNNARLKLVERTAGAQVHLRGNEITIEGEDAAAQTAKAAVEQLYDLALAGKALTSDDVVRAV